ncbi:MAG: helix-turn-helix transcriptional regulator [Clostridiales bacterium]|nr:helix-turn-helix transcriptional regulator [Clostridiales bacterium]
MEVTSRFAALLGERRKKISDVARATGISRTTLTHLYYGTSRAVSFETLNKLCQYFGCGVGDILTRTKEDTP